MTCAAFLPPRSGPEPRPRPGAAPRGCLANLGLAGAVILAGLGLWRFGPALVPAGSVARGSRAVAPLAGPAVDLKTARRSWGAIRARYPATDRRVPA